LIYDKPAPGNGAGQPILRALRPRALEEIRFGRARAGSGLIDAIRPHVAKRLTRDKFCIDAPPTGLL